MTYPSSPGFRSGSETSENAAMKLSGADNMREMMYDLISGEKGATIDQCAAYLTEKMGRMVATGTAAARMIELERSGKVSKTPMKRMTRSGRPAVVYVKGTWSNLMGIEPTKPAEQPPPPETAYDRLQRYKTQLSKFGHGNIVALKVDRKKCGSPYSCRTCLQERQYIKMLEEQVEEEENGR